MNLLEGMKKNNTVTNTRGSNYYLTTYDSNLDVFTMISRYNSEEKIINLFNNALLENEDLALANLLYILDIRNGKGERRIFKIIFKYLCLNHPACALRILPFISELGRYDYILEGLDTPINDNVVSLIKKQLELDLEAENPSLLAKWLPSHRTHGINNEIAKKLMFELKMTEKEYRKLLAKLRSKLNIVEKNLTERTYENIDFNKVPTKALLKYNNAYINNMKDKYLNYKEQVKSGSAKINTEGLFAYEIINKLLWDNDVDDDLYNLMWQNQKDVLNGCNTNVLVMADTSGSMTTYHAIPYATAIGLAIYTAEHNNGMFKNHFITFSKEPHLCEIKGNTIKEKIKNIPFCCENTDIDKAFELILKTAIENNLKQEDLPSHLLIISDMEFDKGVYSVYGTNLSGWQQAFKVVGYKLPIIIFWNVIGAVHGVPATKFDQDVIMINGFSINILSDLFLPENNTINNLMLNKLAIYLEMLKN